MIYPQALEYIAGYLCKNYNNILPSVRDLMYKMTKKNTHMYLPIIPSLVQQLSYGGLNNHSNL